MRINVYIYIYIYIYIYGWICVGLSVCLQKCEQRGGLISGIFLSGARVSRKSFFVYICARTTRKSVSMKSCETGRERRRRSACPEQRGQSFRNETPMRRVRHSEHWDVGPASHERRHTAMKTMARWVSIFCWLCRIFSELPR